MRYLKSCQATLVIAISIFIAACGSGSNSGGNNPPPVTYTVGGSVSGLSGSGLVLQNNGSDNLTVKQSGAFSFSSPVDSGSSYKVTVLTQPSDPTQTCTVTNGSGTANANVSVTISCTTVTFTVTGSVQGLVGVGLVLQDNLANNLSIAANGSFTFSAPVDGGTPYSVTVLTQPAAPSQTCSPSNASGTANANVTAVTIVCTDDNPVGQWKWVDGPDMTNQPGIYTAPGAIPGARYNAVTWTDKSGNFWLFGGNGYDSQGHSGDLNDLWKYGAGEWTSMSSSTALDQSGIYGTQKVPASTNTPGSRQSAVAWTDSAGNFWLFGGSGGDSAGTIGYLNDLWKYSGGQWTWMSGSDLANQSGTYGTKGIASSSNIPASRSGAVEWTDQAGNFWIFGGFAVGSNGNGNVNDLWKYGTNGEWTWVAGSNTIDQAGTYGTVGKAASTNMPGSRNSAMGWVDSAGNFWLFGGEGSDTNDQSGDLNDMWEYSAGQWTWIGGKNVNGQPGQYGTEGKAGTTTSPNVPGSRDSAVALTDTSGNFWLFAGNGLASTTVRGSLNDIWEYTGGQWIWMSGSNTANEKGTYGVEGTAAADNIPGGRAGSVGFIDAAGGFWFFGGSFNSTTQFSDLWFYLP